MWGVSLTPPVLTLVLCGEFVLRIPCCIDFYGRSFSYISRARFFIFFIPFFLSREFLLHIPCWFLLVFRGRFSHISHAGFIFIWGVSLTHPVLASLLSVEFLLHIPCCIYSSVWSFSYTSHAVFTLLCGVSLTYPKLGFLVFLEKRLIWWVSLTYPVGFIFIWGVSLTHPVMAWPLSGEFLLHNQCWL